MLPLLLPHDLPQEHVPLPPGNVHGIPGRILYASCKELLGSHACGAITDALTDLLTGKLLDGQAKREWVSSPAPLFMSC